MSKTMTDYKSITESPFYEKANKYVEETGNNDCTLEAYIDGATEATKELQEKLVTIQKDNIRKAELQKRETLAEKLEYLKQVEYYAIFNDDTKIMFWTSCMKSEIIQELQNGNFVLTVNEIIEGKDKKIADLEKQIEELKLNCDLILEGKDNEIDELKEELNYAKTHCLFHSDCPTQKENAELKAQIEKMKCCTNCRHSRTDYEHCKTKDHEKWELAE